MPAANTSLDLVLDELRGRHPGWFIILGECSGSYEAYGFHLVKPGTWACNRDPETLSKTIRAAEAKIPAYELVWRVLAQDSRTAHDRLVEKNVLPDVGHVPPKPFSAELSERPFEEKSSSVEPSSGAPPVLRGHSSREERRWSLYPESP